MTRGEVRGSVVVIAEIGVNHNGSLDLAKELVSCAAEAGADYAKFQTFRAENLATSAAPVANYQKVSFPGERQLDLLASLELSEENFTELVAYCREQGIGFLTTAHDLASAPFVFGLNSDFIKVPSGDVTNFPFLRAVGRQHQPVLLSTGASRGDEVLTAIEVLESQGLPRAQITVMQCTTQYPAPIEEANLRAMVAMGQQWGVSIGYSDHTLGQNSALAAVALGATVLEKHITLDRMMEGPDHAASLEPDEFARMVEAVRGVGLSLGHEEKEVTSAESQNRDVIRKSIVAIQPIAVGELLTEENLGVMRPGTGISPMKWVEVIGQPARRSYEAHDMIELS